MKTNIFQRTPGIAPALVISWLAVAAVSSAVELPTVPSAFDIVYKLKAYKPLPATQVKTLVALTGITEATARSSRKFGTVTYIVDPKKPTNFFNLDQATGALSFSRDLTMYEGDFAPRLPRTDEEAQRIARDYLTNNKLMPDLAPGDSMIFAGVQTVSAARPPVAGRPIVNGFAAPNIAPFDKLKIVTFRRQIYGLPVIGPGSKIVVTIGDQNTVEGVIHRWRPFIAPDKPPTTTTATANAAATAAPVITPATALAALLARLQKKFPDFDTESLNNMIRTMDVGLYDSNQGAIQPVYVFQLDLNRRATQPLPGTDIQELFLTASPYLKTPPEAIYQLGDIPNNEAPKSTATD